MRLRNAALDGSLSDPLTSSSPPSGDFDTLMLHGSGEGGIACVAGSASYVKFGQEVSIEVAARSRDSPLLFRLADLDEVAVGIAHVAARLGLVNLRFGEELRTQTFPTFIAFCDVRDADVHEAADSADVHEAADSPAILRRREVDVRLVVGRPAADIDDDPRVLELDDARRAVLAVHDDFPAEDPRVEVQRLLYVHRNEKVRHGEARAGTNFVGGIWHFSDLRKTVCVLARWEFRAEQ